VGEASRAPSCGPERARYPHGTECDMQCLKTETQMIPYAERWRVNALGCLFMLAYHASHSLTRDLSKV
jgi:hypothetical protein